MKDNYYINVLEFKNLYNGMKKSCRNVRWKDSVVGYEMNGVKNTLDLRKDLLNGKYRISKYQHFTIYEPKKREITATRIRDRQFQRSLCDNGLYQDITEHFIRDNIACQKGRGTDDALNRMKTHLHRFYRKYGTDGWVLKCDIHHFFAETNHDKLKAIVDKYVSDKNVCEHVYQIIDSFGGENGIGLGSEVSQLLELLFLNDFDHWIKERLHIKYYIRYMDDFVLIHQDKQYLAECRSLIVDRLKELGLALNHKTSMFPIHQGIKFLKWRFLLTDTGKVLMLIDEKKIAKEKRRIRKLLQKEKNGELPKGTARTSLDSWIANAERGNTYRIINRMNAWFCEVSK